MPYSIGDTIRGIVASLFRLLAVMLAMAAIQITEGT